MHLIYSLKIYQAKTDIQKKEKSSVMEKRNKTANVVISGIPERENKVW